MSNNVLEASDGLLQSLPESVAISCLARVSRLDYAALSLVSKSCRSLVVSSELYQTRSLMGYAETLQYICLRMPPYYSTTRWFIIRQTLDAATGITLNHARPIPSIPSQPPDGSSVVVLDWRIYIIGGWVNNKRTSSVLLLDCRSHKWQHVTPMRVARASAMVRLVDKKICVLGGCNYDSDLGEVFDPKTQTWAILPDTKRMLDTDPNKVPIMSSFGDIVVIEDKVYVKNLGDRTFYCFPSQGQRKSLKVLQPMTSRDWCVKDKLIYSCGTNGGIYWCEPEELDRCEPLGIWKKVLGLKSLKKMLCESRVVHFVEKMVKVWESYKIIYKTSKNLEELRLWTELINCDQNIVVFWDVVVYRGGHKCFDIWCAEISLERQMGGEVWGKIKWSDCILTVNPILCYLCSSKLLYSIHVDL